MGQSAYILRVKVELTELRMAINQLRANALLGNAIWIPDPDPQGGFTLIKAAHILQLSVELEDALSHLQLPTGAYAPPGLMAGSLIYAIDFQELRD